MQEEVRALPDQVVHVTEFMHPRLQEICDTLPAWAGSLVLRSKAISALLSPLFRKGRHVTSTRLGWFLVLYVIAGLRPWRRGTLRYRQEQARIEAWLSLACDAAKSDTETALELVLSQGIDQRLWRYIRPGLAEFRISSCRLTGSSRAGRTAPPFFAIFGSAALKDEEGHALSAALAQLGLAVDAA